jgi:hypothetical protein
MESKTLNDIKQEVAIEYHFSSWTQAITCYANVAELDEIITKVSERYLENFKEEYNWSHPYHKNL